MTLDESAPYAFLFDVTPAFRDEGSEDRPIFGQQRVPFFLEYVVFVPRDASGVPKQPPPKFRENPLFIDERLRVDDKRRHRAFERDRRVVKRQNRYLPLLKELPIRKDRYLLVDPDG